MTESYRGVVVQVHCDEATVVYDVDGDILEHVYVRSQFSDGRLPAEGERLELVVHVSEIEADDLNTQKSVVSDATSPRKTLRPVSDEF
jgi:hypothetical protein